MSGKAMKYLLVGLMTLLASLNAAAFEAFVVSDISVEGLQRIPARVVYKTLPINVGDKVDEALISRSMKALFALGDFDDVAIARQQNKLIVTVSERPSVSEIKIEGNKSIATDSLMTGLSQAGLEKGGVFQRATLDRMRYELERQYVAQGRYGARVDTQVDPLPRNRVALHIKIDEGKVASITHIAIIGNHLIKTQTLLELFQLKEKQLWSFFSSSDQYAREKLAGDLESLRSYYLDRGYINFAINSTQVSVSPDRSQVYITINISEGELFKVEKVSIAGDLPLDESLLEKLLLVKKGQTFSRQLITLSENFMTKRLGDEGFLFAQVKAIPDIDEKNHQVNLVFFVNPEKRAYVKRIQFSGNQKTKDEVLRREMRQFEGAWASGEKIDQSKVRLERLGFFKNVAVDTQRVPGTDDQVDVNFTVEEQPSGSVGASIGYQAGTGFIFGANVSQSNFLGTGNQVTVDVQRTSYQNRANFSYVNPYFTQDGVSRGFNIYYSQTDYSHINISSYSADALGTGFTFGYPINENERLNFGFGLDQTKISANKASAPEVLSFINYDAAADGTQLRTLNSLTVNGSWVRSTLNQGLLPDRGARHRLSVEAAVPGSNLSYYKLDYQGEKYFPLFNPWIIRARTEIGYGDGLTGTNQLPFFKNFFAGGAGSVRGYSSRSLGPKDSLGVDPFGGNLLAEGAMELIFPTPFVKDKRSVRTLFFLDGGNVFDRSRHDAQNIEINLREIRYSAGLSFSWITAVGPLTFTFSKPINSAQGDQTQFFDFSLGQIF